jgi:hypothetical protein
MSFTLPAEVNAVVAAFAVLFSQPVWKHAQALLCGAILAPKASTITAALRVIGLGNEARFCNYHRVLSRSSWDGRQAARTLLELLVKAFAAAGQALGSEDHRTGHLP